MYCSAFRAIGQSVAVTMRKIRVKAASTSDRAISLGVRWRMAPSTRAIMRSRKVLPGRGGDLHDDAVGEDAGAAGHAGAVAAGLADHRGRFAGDGRFVDRGHAFDDLAVAGDHLAGLDQHDVARLAAARRRSLPLPVAALEAAAPFCGNAQPPGGRLAARLPQGVGLGLAPGLGDRRGEIGEQQRQHEPEVQRQQITDARRALVAQQLGDRVDERQDGARPRP